ncbi:TrbI/VirB10 family protein [Consotaella aegiceratis]|uniref:TrbI/VirB10 family protein n=1 Tax=Consotaella aegiceratis TaxID=3097961 RepID=UPI002F4216E4
MSDPTDRPAANDREGSAQAFRLRPAPPRVTRLSRKVLTTLGLGAGLLIGGALVYALQGQHHSNAPSELLTADRQPTPDGLRSLPSDYTQVPKLGPPLPGDLGRPIVRARDEGKPVPAPAVPGATREEQRRLQEQEAALTSRLFVAQQAGRGAAESDGGAASAAQGTGAPLAQDRQLAFVNAPADHRTVSAERLASPPSPYVLQTGAVIAAALVTGIRSDLPGQITAQVTENVFDSPTGRFLLIPQGTRLIGTYDHGVEFGQRRILLVWNRLILPNGKSIVLERLPGVDTQGYAGLEDDVDHHWWDLAKAAGLSTLLGVGAELATDDDDRLVQAIQNGAEDTVNDAGQEIIRRELDVAPTLTVRPGFPVRIIVTRDLVLEPYGS